MALHSGGDKNGLEGAWGCRARMHIANVYYSGRGF